MSKSGLMNLHFRANPRFILLCDVFAFLPKCPSSLKLRRAFSTAWKMVGLAGLEPATPRLSSVCSNQLSYRPNW